MPNVETSDRIFSGWEYSGWMVIVWLSYVCRFVVFDGCCCLQGDCHCVLWRSCSEWVECGW